MRTPAAGTGLLNAIVVGFGHLGSFHAQKYLGMEAQGIKLVALVDPRAEEIKAKAEKTAPGVPLFASLADYFAAVNAGKVARAQLASVSTTTEFHLSAGLALLKEGVHILVEKPLAGHAKDGLALVEAAEKAGLVLAVGQVERHRAMEALRTWNAHPLFLECHRLSPFPARSVDIDVIFDLMIHDIDLMLAMV
ncbi:MAG: Gfo/Idh/MocA family oxidoreductase, partial [Proteobacteria bacterium]